MKLIGKACFETPCLVRKPLSSGRLLFRTTKYIHGDITLATSDTLSIISDVHGKVSMLWKCPSEVLEFSLLRDLPFDIPEGEGGGGLTKTMSLNYFIFVKTAPCNYLGQFMFLIESESCKNIQSPKKISAD